MCGMCLTFFTPLLIIGFKSADRRALLERVKSSSVHPFYNREMSGKLFSGRRELIERTLGQHNGDAVSASCIHDLATWMGFNKLRCAVSKQALQLAVIFSFSS